MKKIFFLFLAIVLSGCVANKGVRGPESMKETNPFLSSRDGDPTVGLFIIQGKSAVVLEFYDNVGHLAFTWNEKGDIKRGISSPVALTVNGHRRKPKSFRVYKTNVPIGIYRIAVRPFYYYDDTVIELPVKERRLVVDDVVNSYDRKHTMRYWGFILKIKTGKVPKRKKPRVGIDLKIPSGGPLRMIYEWDKRRREEGK